MASAGNKNRTDIRNAIFAAARATPSTSQTALTTAPAHWQRSANQSKSQRPAKRTGPDVVAVDHSHARSNAENCVDKHDWAIGNGRHDQSAATRQKSSDEQNNCQSNEARQIDS